MKNVMRFASTLHKQGAIYFNSVILVQKDYIHQIDSLCKSSSRFEIFGWNFWAHAVVISVDVQQLMPGFKWNPRGNGLALV